MKANLQIPSLALASLVAIALVRCGASDDDGAAGSGGSGAAAPADASVGSGGTGGGSTSDGSVPEAAPPEQELESSYRTPVSTGRYVWTANPDSGRVALIDAFTMEIRIEEAGFGPTYLAAISDPLATDDNSAIVLNVHSHDATLFQVAKDGALTKRSFETHEGANAWVVSPNGNWAIAWTEAPSSADPTQGNQDVTVIDLAGGGSDATRLSVGYRPTRVAFDAAESRIFAVTEPGITVISLENSSPTVDRLIEVTDDPLENPASRDVTITPDGSLALVRRDGSADVGLVDLTTGARTAIPLSAPVTDLDLTEDGTLAVAVVRDSAEIVIGASPWP